MSELPAGLEFGGDLWMQIGGVGLGGKGRIALLALIAESGSISQAAKQFGMSYKAAWDAVSHMNNLAGAVLVERVSGGKGGGGSRVTAAGLALIGQFRLFESAHQQFIQTLTARHGDIRQQLALIQRLAMKTSIRNQFAGIVSKVQHGAVNDEIRLDIGAGQTLIAVIPSDCSSELALQPGSQVVALIPSSDIILVSADQAARFSARNQLCGTISRILTGAVNTEVSLALSDGHQLSAMITNDSAVQLELAAGKRCNAIFKASSVIICTQG